jgi:hypothetical protein
LREDKQAGEKNFMARPDGSRIARSPSFAGRAPEALDDIFGKVRRLFKLRERVIG